LHQRVTDVSQRAFPGRDGVRGTSGGRPGARTFPGGEPL